MGSLIRRLQNEENKDAFFSKLTFDEDMLPELMLLGTLEHREVPMDDGRLFSLDIIHYEGKQYVMKESYIKRWFDER